MFIPILLIGGGIAIIFAAISGGEDGPVPDHQPDLPPTPGSTGYSRVDAILPELKQAAQSSGIPLGLLVGWIAKESGGKLADTTSLDERGYFQLMPSESQSLGLDHERLSTDEVYSINAGLLLIGQYMKDAQALNIAPMGSSYFWRVVKWIHSQGLGAVKKIVAEAQAAGETGSWNALEGYALENDAHFLSTTKHSPKKWMTFVDSVYKLGAPFGFGTDSSASVVALGADAGTLYADIIDPIDCLKR